VIRAHGILRAASGGFDDRVADHLIVVVTFIVLVRVTRRVPAVVGIVGVADDVVIHFSFVGVEIPGAIRADELLDFGAVELAFPSAGQRLVHVTGDDERIGGLPGLGSVMEKRKFERKIVLVGGEEGVDAASVSGEKGAGVVVEGGEFAIGDAAEAEGAEGFIGFEGERADDFRELAARGAAEQVELEEAVLGHDVALGFYGVFERSGADMRDTPVVAIYGDWRFEAGNLERAVELRKGTVEKIPGGKSDGDEENGENPDEEANKFPQASSRRQR